MKPDPFKSKNFNLTGRWQVLHRVESSSLSRYVGLEIEFDVELKQDGDQLTGSGEKFVVGWQLAGRDEASRLNVDGRVEDGDVQLAITERSPKNPSREIVGEIFWKRLIGSFRVDAADSRGSSRAIRREPEAGI